MNEHDYYKRYTGVQWAKHNLIREYLKAWFPIMMRYEKEVVYIETHAGQGVFETKEPGSPIVALQTLKDHISIPGLTSEGKSIQFIFFEKDPKIYSQLVQQIAKMRPLPEMFNVEHYQVDYKRYFDSHIEQGLRLKPALLAIDPYNYDLPHKQLLYLFQSPKCEILITFMVRYIGLAINSPNQGLVNRLDHLFGSKDWLKCSELDLWEDKVNCLIDTYVSSFGDCYHSVIKMMGETKSIEYVLIHLSKSPKGREKFKEAMWKTFPSGQMVAYKSNNPRQFALLSGSPNLSILANSIIRKFAGQRVSYGNCRKWLLGTDYLPKHFHQVCRQLERQNIISCSTGKFVVKQAPDINFPSKVIDVSKHFH